MAPWLDAPLDAIPCLETTANRGVNRAMALGTPRPLIARRSCLAPLRRDIGQKRERETERNM